MTKVFHTSPTFDQLKEAQLEGFTHARTPYLGITEIGPLLRLVGQGDRHESWFDYAGKVIAEIPGLKGKLNSLS